MDPVNRIYFFSDERWENCKIKTRPSGASQLDTDLVYRGIKTDVPHEILQIRAVFANGIEQLMFEVEGGHDEVKIDAEEIVAEGK